MSSSQKKQQAAEMTEEEWVAFIAGSEVIIRKACVHLRALGDAIRYPFLFQGTEKELARFICEHFVFPNLEEVKQ